MFAMIQGLSYSDSLKYVSPGSGLPEGVFNSLEHSQYYELETRLTFKGYQWKKGARRKTMTNPTMMYTMFSVFVEDSPQQVRRNMVQWINDNKQKFESQTMLAFTAKDSELDLWLSNIDSNSTPGNEFVLFALCQMYTRHALIVTSNQCTSQAWSRWTWPKKEMWSAPDLPWRGCLWHPKTQVWVENWCAIRTYRDDRTSRQTAVGHYHQNIE